MILAICCQNRGPSILQNKTWKIMKLITIFLFLIVMQISAKGFSQKISINREKVSLETIFSIVLFLISFLNLQISFAFFISISLILLIELPPNIFAYLTIFPICFFSLWSYSVTRMLSKKNKYDTGIKLVNFTINLILATLYLIFISIYFALTHDTEDPKWFLLVILIGHSYLFFSVLYLINFIAKILSTVELKRVTKFNDFVVYFFMLFFFPIGVWWLYPKIRAAIAS